jgi:hypothetical protein
MEEAENVEVVEIKNIKQGFVLRGKEKLREGHLAALAKMSYLVNG